MERRPGFPRRSGARSGDHRSCSARKSWTKPSTTRASWAMWMRSSSGCWKSRTELDSWIPRSQNRDLGHPAPGIGGIMLIPTPSLRKGTMAIDGRVTFPGGSKSRVNKAGDAVRNGNPTPDDIDVIDRWREAHRYVLNTFQAILRNRTKNSRIVVAQRHKRKRTIFGKLQRFPGWNLRVWMMLRGVG